MAHKFFRDDREVPISFICRADDFPLHSGCDLRDPSVDFSIEILYDFRPPLIPPHLRGSNLPSILQYERVRQIGIRIGFRLVVIDAIWSVRMTALRTRSQ